MTTIVIDIKNKKIYSDTQLTSDYKSTTRKVFKIKNDTYCISGVVLDCFKFIEKLKDGKKVNTSKMDFDIIHIDEDGDIFNYSSENNNKHFCQVFNKDYIVIGSGSKYVEAIYHYNIANGIKIDFKKIIQAVSKIDPYTNESIEVFDY